MERDEGALRTVMETYGGVVHGIARRIVAEPTLAQEVVQDTFLALWNRPGMYDPERGSLQAFLLGVARNKAIDLVRKEEALKKARDVLISDAKTTSEEALGYELSEEIHVRQVIRAALAKLSDVQRQAIVLAYFGGRTYREVAEELNIPEGTAKTRMRDGLIRLRQVMADARGRQA